MTPEESKIALKLAGKLAIMAGEVVRSSVKELSNNIMEMEAALNAYDNYIISLTDKKS